MEINKELEKFFKGTEGSFALKKFTRNELNKYVLKKILESDSGKYLAKKQKHEQQTPDFQMIDPLNYKQTFFDSFWKNSTFEQKIKSVNFFIEEYNSRFGIKQPLKLSLIPPENLDNSNISACYFKGSNEIYLNLDNLSNISGLEMYSILVHETTHAKDFAKLKTKIIPDLCKDVLGREVEAEKVDSLLLMLDFLNIENSDVYHSHLDGKLKKVSTGLRSNITLAKNYAQALSPTGVKTLSDVDTIEDFAKYAQNILYLHSPLERRARFNALIETQSLMENAPSDLPDSQDFADLKMLEESELSYNEQIKTFKSLLTSPLRDFLENTFKYTFLTQNYSSLAPMYSIGDSVQKDYPIIQRKHISEVRRAYAQKDKLLKIVKDD